MEITFCRDSFIVYGELLSSLSSFKLNSGRALPPNVFDLVKVAATAAVASGRSRAASSAGAVPWLGS